MPRHSSRCLYEDEEFNVKTASEYKQLDCLGIYDTLSEIGRRKREFVYREAEFKLRLIIRRTCTGEVISHLYRNKLDVAERGERGPGGEGPSGRSGGGGPGAEPLSRGVLCRSSRYNKVQLYYRSSRYNKVQLYCRSAGRQRALSLPNSDKFMFSLKSKNSSTA